MNKGKLLFVCFMWLCLLSVFVTVVKFWWMPKKQQEVQQQVAEEHKQSIQRTSSPARYDYEVSFAIDSFSGYAPFRTQTFADECAKHRIHVTLTDDKANYKQRLQDLANSKVDIAVFPIDALIKTSAELNDFPATIVALTDESNGADGVVAAGAKYPNIDSINTPNTKLVCVADSPSETIGRLLMANFSLDQLGSNPFVFKNSAEEVYAAYRQSKLTDDLLFIPWEPWLSTMTDNPDYHCLIDSSKFRGRILDAIVVRRGYLLKQEDLVEKLLKCYLTTVYMSRNTMVDIVSEDARALGTPLKRERAERLVKGVWWKNTQENFAHFGFTRVDGLPHIDDMCRNLIVVLRKTGSIKADPTDGRPNMLYYDGVIRRLFDQSWHPGFGIEDVRADQSLANLSDDDWNRLKPVGTLQIPRLVFARGTAGLTAASEATLAELVETLKSFPQYYLTVRGSAASSGNLDANMKLAIERASAAMKWLVGHGVSPQRIRSEASKPNGSTTVLFILGEMPY